MFDWLTKNGSALALVGTAVWTVWQYAAGKRAEMRKHQFEAYHELVKQLVQSDTPDTSMKIDRQVAIIFELRHFPRYHPVTQRILVGLQKSWTQTAPEFHRLRTEIDLTLQHIAGYPRWWAPWRNAG